MKKITLLASAILMASCVTVPAAVKTAGYSTGCKTVVNEGEIDAHEVVNMQKKTTFKAAEYSDCPDNKTLVVISWHGEYTVVKINLAKQIIGNYFNHFYPRDIVDYVEVDSTSAAGFNTIVFEFTRTVRAY